MSSTTAPPFSTATPPPPPASPLPASSFTPLVCVVDFHHHRGPEIEHWIGCGPPTTPDTTFPTANAVPPSLDPACEAAWQLIPYMALPDGAHQMDEEFSYFSLVYRARPSNHEEHSEDETEKHTASTPASAISVFGISCVRRISSSELRFRPEEVTRSAVQKAVVAITDKPQGFSALREKLSVVTSAWFAQRDFRDVEILQRFQESLEKDSSNHEDERDQYFGLSLRELVHTFKWQTLMLLKSLLLQPKILFFGSHCERLCQVQFALISLVPGLVGSLQDCADPSMDQLARLRRKPDSVRTSDRTSLLEYVGLPLQLFGKGSMFGPYTPLQQLDTITDQHTKSYMVGSTNSLLLQQKERYCDILVNLDDDTVTILNPALKPALSLSVADRRLIDFITHTVNDTWDKNDPSRPSTHGYSGSEEFIRLQFEEYLIALLSATKYHHFLLSHKAGLTSAALLPDIDGDPSTEFSPSFLDAWQQSENYSLWHRTTDSHLFDIVEPRHPCAGGLTIEDVQRRLATQVAELHLDERLNQTREAVGKRLADGRVQVTSAFNKVWADLEALREEQRKRSDEAKAAAAAAAAALPSPPPPAASGSTISSPTTADDPSAIPPGAGHRASAYFSSWSSWAADRRRSGWYRSSSSSSVPVSAPAQNTPPTQANLSPAPETPESSPPLELAVLSPVPMQEGNDSVVNIAAPAPLTAPPASAKDLTDTEARDAPSPSSSSPS